MLREITDRERFRRMALARQRRQRSGDGLEQRRFARAVRAEQADAVAAADSPVEILENRSRLAVAERRGFEQHELLRDDACWREREFERAVDVRGRDPFHPLERFDPALRLLRLRCLCAEAVDERLQVRDLPLLFDVGRLLQRELHRPLALELRVVARVRLDLQLIDVRDHRHDTVQEIPVVRDEQKRSGIAREPVLEPQHGVQVEVIGRFVEEKEIRPAHQRLRQVEPHPPAAGECRDRVAMARRRKP
jgi:hypothetical protein